MSLTLVKVQHPGDLRRERVFLRALSDVELGHYLILQAADRPDGFDSSDARLLIWFPDGTISRGDRVFVYTKRGSAHSEQRPSGSTNHRFYLGAPKTIWTREHSAILVKADFWTAESVPEEEAG